jgi:hypothetical protein
LVEAYKFEEVGQIFKPFILGLNSDEIEDDLVAFSSLTKILRTEKYSEENWLF